ncbi:glycosyltransferase family A protein [uncultured Kordia sp.]|uniref:glycosyltransferase family 2 protein n=1 Tax=uncultured Kordia sp. TaxID=507699 RepID=UPI0026183D12|nr:glycosyltransferase family A protein [uncultured Kordia sp.]
MPLFSVIIPLYNKAMYIQETIESVLQQHFSDYEIIVVNDASTDDSLQIVSTISDPRISIIDNPKNLGLSATRNVGISKAKGNIIALLDADDMWLPNFLDTIKNLHDSFPEAAIYGTDYSEIYTTHKAIESKKNIPISLKGTSFVVNDFFIANMFQPIFNPSCLAFKKIICEDSNVFDSAITFSEDIDFYIKYGSKHKVAYHYESLVKMHFDVPNQMTRSAISKKTLPDLDRYETLAKNNVSLKKFLDLYRYIYASLYHLENAKLQKKKMLQQIDYANLTLKQRLLLKSPRFISILLKKLKGILLKYNIKVTSF